MERSFSQSFLSEGSRRILHRVNKVMLEYKNRFDKIGILYLKIRQKGELFQTPQHIQRKTEIWTEKMWFVIRGESRH